MFKTLLTILALVVLVSSCATDNQAQTDDSGQGATDVSSELGTGIDESADVGQDLDTLEDFNLDDLIF